MSRIYPTYDECRCYVVLTDVFGLKNITLSDKPDLISDDKKFGIEIVSALSEDVHKVDTYFENLKDEKNKFVLPKTVKEISTGFVIGPDDNIESDIQKINKMIRVKRQKKNNYEKTEKLGLYITSYLTEYPNIDVNDICSKIYKDNIDEFDFIIFEFLNNGPQIVCCYGDKNIIINIADQDYIIGKKAKEIYNCKK